MSELQGIDLDEAAFEVKFPHSIGFRRVLNSGGRP
jgi:hypothetical protein